MTPHDALHAACLLTGVAIGATIGLVFGLLVRAREASREEGEDVRLTTIEKQRVALDLLNAYAEIGHPHDDLSRSLVAEARRWTSRPDGDPPPTLRETLLDTTAKVESIADLDALLGTVTPEEEALLASMDLDAPLTAEERMITGGAAQHREWCADTAEFQGTACECGAQAHHTPAAADPADLDASRSGGGEGADDLEKAFMDWAHSPRGFGRFKGAGDPRIPFEHGWRAALAQRAAATSRKSGEHRCVECGSGLCEIPDARLCDDCQQGLPCDAAREDGEG